MMPYLSDRRRIELALPAEMLDPVVRVMLERGKNAEDDKCLDLVKAAIREPFEGVDPAKRAKLQRRVTALRVELLAPYEGRPIVLTFQMLIIWLRDMIEDGTLDLVEGSAFALATDDLIARVIQHEDLVLKTQKSAIKNAHKLRRNLEIRGYYPGRGLPQAGAA
ncbi:hypothetical protein [Thalassospira sp.]|uniref:hypothetical protein n=1 Tax=Thalassospira sp. TaxID=1912094 RepID=UPI003AA7D343